MASTATWARRAIFGLLAVAGLLVMHGITAHGLGQLHEHPGAASTHDLHDGNTYGHEHDQGHGHGPRHDHARATAPAAATDTAPATATATATTTAPSSAPTLHLHLMVACLAVLVAALIIAVATRALRSPSSAAPRPPWASLPVPRIPTPHRQRVALCVERC